MRHHPVSWSDRHRPRGDPRGRHAAHGPAERRSARRGCPVALPHPTRSAGSVVLQRHHRSGGACPLADPPSESSMASTQARGESWGCQTVTTVRSPVLRGDQGHLEHGHGHGPEDGDSRESIARPPADRERGRGMGGHLDRARGRPEFHESAGWFIGEGAYDGLAAYVMTDADTNTIRGVIRPDDGFGLPAAFADE